MPFTIAIPARQALVAATALLLLTAACSDDKTKAAPAVTTRSSTSTSTTTAIVKNAAGVDVKLVGYCALAKKVEAHVPTAVDDLHAFQAVAPADVRPQADVVVKAFEASIALGDPGRAFADPSVYEELKKINAFDARHCAIPQDPGDFQDPSITQTDPSAKQVAVTATDYKYAFDTPTSGRTTFTMTNKGHLSHVMVLQQLAKGVTAGQALVGDSNDPKLVKATYGSNIAAPGGVVYLTVDLPPANYLMFCYLPTKDNKLHLTLGQLKTFTVQ